MASYTHEFSNFPDTLYVRGEFEDLADAPSSVVDVVTQIKQYVIEGKYTDAANLLTINKDALAPYYMDANHINALDEELRNVEIYVKGQRQGIYLSDTMPDCVIGDVWIG